MIQFLGAGLGSGRVGLDVFKSGAAEQDQRSKSNKRSSKPFWIKNAPDISIQLPRSRCFLFFAVASRRRGIKRHAPGPDPNPA